MNNRPRTIALCATVAIAVAVLLLLRFTTLSLSALPEQWPPRHDGEIAMADDERFFDVVEDLPLPESSSEQAAQAVNPVKENNQSDPAPQSGHDMSDRGAAGDAPATVTSKRPSPVKKEVTEQKKPVGPSKEEIAAREAEEARRKANAATASAFQKASGKNNTANKGKTEGNSGSPSGSSKSVNGTGSGTVGGGWRLPAYAKVPATVTGTIKMMVRIDRQGKVTSVSFQGGDAPAATDSRLRAAVAAEVRSRRFTRADSNAPDQATAYITYRFK